MKPPGQEEDDSCPDRLLLLSQEVPEDEGHGRRPTVAGKGGWIGAVCHGMEWNAPSSIIWLGCPSC